MLNIEQQCFMLYYSTACYYYLRCTRNQVSFQAVEDSGRAAQHASAGLLTSATLRIVDTGSRNLLFRGRMAISDSPVKAVHDAYRPETSAADRDATLGREAT